MTTHSRFRIRRCALCGTRLSDHPIPEDATRNETADPAPTGPATKVDTKAVMPPDGGYTRGIDPAILRCGKPAHLAVTRMISCALVENKPEVWGAVPPLLELRLDPRERRDMAAACVASLEPENIEAVMEEVSARTGIPLPPLFSRRDAAADWATFASRGEHFWFVVEGFNQLSPADQMKVLGYIHDEVRR